MHPRKQYLLNKVVKGHGIKKRGGWLAPIAMAASSLLPSIFDRIFPQKQASGKKSGGRRKRGGRRKGKSITTPIMSGPLA
jgi:hypothetical protein